MREQKTEIQLKKQSDLTESNNKLRWFCVAENYECKTVILKKDWYEKTSTGITKNGNWIHTVKSRTTKEFYIISDTDYQKIITKFSNRNKHLIK